MGTTRHDNHSATESSGSAPAPTTSTRATSNKATSTRAARLSLLWTFALMNYLYCDVLGLTDPVVLKDLINGTGPVDMTQGFLLGSAVLMEIPIAMVLLSIVLPASVNRWASIVAGTVMTLVQVASLFVGAPTMYYAFFTAIEIATTAFVVWYAWTWRRPEA